MFCPQCRTEYREGIRICTDCGAPLTSELPPLPAPAYVEFEEILSTFNAGDIAFIKSLLDGEGIAYHFLGELFTYAEPLVQPARLMVRKDQAQKAREILQGMTMSYTGVGVETDEAPEEDE